MERHAFTLQLTEKCNLACLYCYVQRRTHPDPIDCTPAFCEKFVDFAFRESRTKVKITFFGGEPLLFPDLIRHTVACARKTAAVCGERPIGFHLVTNGTLLDEEIGDFIAEERIGLEISIDGPEAVHDANRIYPDGSPSFRRVYTNLLRFVERHPDHPVSIFSVISAPDSLPWLQALCRGIDAQGFTYNPMRLAHEDQQRAGTHKAVNHALQNRIARHRDAFLRGDVDFDEEITSQMGCLLGDGNAQPCEAGINATIITRTGDIYPCPFFVGHPDQVIGTIDNGFDPDKAKPFTDRHLSAMKSCRRCGARQVCASGCAFDSYEQTGRVDRPAKPACADTRRYVRRLSDALVRLASGAPEDLLKKILSPLPVEPSPPTERRPRSFVIRLTGRCNLACDYCYEKGNISRDDLDISTARTIIHHILGNPEPEPLVCLFGGEPLLNWKTGEFLIGQIAAGAERMGKRPFFHMTTNGTLITPEIARTLARHDVTVQVSIDGTRESHDHHRKHADGSGSWDAVRRGIECLHQADPEARIDGQVVLTPGNVDMTAIARTLKEIGFRRISFLVAGWEDRTGVVWSEAEIIALMKAREDFFPFFLKSALGGNADVDMGFAGLVAAEPEGTEGLCECGSGEVFIDTRARIFPCPQLYAAGCDSIGQCGQPHAVNMSGTIGKSEKMIREDCFSCWAFSRCGGGCMVRNQRCPSIPSRLPPEKEKMWCDYMRAEFSRAILAYRILESRRPKANLAIKGLFKTEKDPFNRNGIS